MARRPLMELKYELNRRQRIIPHLAIWLPLLGMPSIIVLLFAYLLVSISVWFILPLLVMLWLIKGFFVGLLDVIIYPKRKMDIVVEEKGLGYLANNERWWIFLCGVIEVSKICSDIWAVQHHNGTIINIPVSTITLEQVETLQSAIQNAKIQTEIQLMTR